MSRSARRRLIEPERDEGMGHDPTQAVTVFDHVADLRDLRAAATRVAGRNSSRLVFSQFWPLAKKSSMSNDKNFSKSYLL